MRTADNEATIEKLKKEFLEEEEPVSVFFEGNDEIEAFYGEITDFFAGSDVTIYVTLADTKCKTFNIDWADVEQGEFS